MAYIMLRKIYLFILICFTVFVLALNGITFFTGMNPRQLVNMFYLSERTTAVMLLFEHVVFESGVILHHPSEDEVRRVVFEECAGTEVHPELVMLIINSHKNRGLFHIDFDGSMGLMRIKSHMLNGMSGANPYVLQDNIKAGVTHLGRLLEEERRLDAVLCAYLKPESSRTVFETDVRASDELALRIYSDYMKLRPQSKPQQDYPAGDIIAYSSYL